MYDIYTFSLEPFIQIKEVNGNKVRVLDERFDFQRTKVKRMTTLKEYGLPFNWHGGNVAKIAELQEEPLFIFATIDNRTLDVGVKKENVHKLSTELFEILAKKYPELQSDSKFKCKVENCFFETSNKGEYLAHCKEHKKTA